MKADVCLVKIVHGVVVTNMSRYDELKEILPRERLYKLLWEDNKSYKDIGEILNYDQHYISQLAKEYEIPKNTKGLAAIKNQYHSINVTKESLYDLYITQQLSAEKISKILNISKDSVLKKLKEYGIPTRKNSDSIYYQESRVVPKSSIRKDRAGYVSKRENFYEDREHRIIYEKYHNIKLTPDQHIHHIDFDKTNNDPPNLFMFNSADEHLSYHGFIKSHGYVSPQNFLDIIYPMIIYYKSKDFLYNQYIVLNKSIAAINKEINNYVSRTVLSKLLKKYNLFDPNKHINQYDS